MDTIDPDRLPDPMPTNIVTLTIPSDGWYAINGDTVHKKAGDRIHCPVPPLDVREVLDW